MYFIYILIFIKINKIYKIYYFYIYSYLIRKNLIFIHLYEIKQSKFISM
jgi:hypothetical protein